MQITRHPPHKGEPYILHVLRVMWLTTIGQRHQERLPGPGRKEEQEQNWIRVWAEGFGYAADALYTLMGRWRAGSRLFWHALYDGIDSIALRSSQNTCTNQHFQVHGGMHQDRTSLGRRNWPRQPEQTEIRKKTKTARKIWHGQLVWRMKHK